MIWENCALMVKHAGLKCESSLAPWLVLSSNLPHKNNASASVALGHGTTNCGHFTAGNLKGQNYWRLMFSHWLNLKINLLFGRTSRSMIRLNYQCWPVNPHMKNSPAVCSTHVYPHRSGQVRGWLGGYICACSRAACRIFTWSIFVALFTHESAGSDHLHVQSLLPVHHPDLDVTWSTKHHVVWCHW